MIAHLRDGTRRYLLAGVLGLAVLPAVLLLRIVVGLVLAALGSGLDAAILWLAPEPGLGGYFMAVVAFRLLTFLLVTALAVEWSRRRWSLRPALVTGAVALVAGGAVAGLAWRSAAEAGERARRSGDELRGRVERSLTLRGLEANVTPGELEIGLPATVRRAGSYRFRLTLTPERVDDPDVATRAFVLDTVIELGVGEQRVPIRIGAADLADRWGMLWRWSETAASEAEVTVGLLLDAAQIEELGGVDLSAMLERLRSAGARSEDLEALRPPEGRRVHKFVSRDTFRLAAVPVLQRFAP